MRIYILVFSNILFSLSLIQASSLQCSKMKVDYDRSPIYLKHTQVVYKVSLRDITCEQKRLRATYETRNIPYHIFRQNRWTSVNYKTVSNHQGFETALFSDTLYQGIILTDTKDQSTLTKSPIRLTFVKSYDSALSTVWLDMPNDHKFKSLKFKSSFIAVK